VQRTGLRGSTMATSRHTQSSITYRIGWCGTARHDLCAGRYAGTACGCACHTGPPVARPVIPTPRAPEPPPLRPVTVTVRCFFGCPAVVASLEAGEAHAAMEGHYWAAHRAAIKAALWGAAA
jgi:hypothetical protein